MTGSSDATTRRSMWPGMWWGARRRRESGFSVTAERRRRESLRCWRWRWALACTACPFSCLRDSQPGRESDTGRILVGVLARAVERAGPHPQDPSPEMVRVPLELGVEEVDGGRLRVQQLVGVVEVLPGLRDGPRGVVVELLVLVPADDVP